MPEMGLSRVADSHRSARDTSKSLSLTHLLVTAERPFRLSTRRNRHDRTRRSSVEKRQRNKEERRSFVAVRGRRRRAAGEVVRATWHASDEPNRNYHHRRRSFIKPRDCVSRSMIVRPLRSGFTQQVFLWDTER